MKRIIPLALLLTVWALPASADWQLDPAHSSLSFTSTKANTAAEVHGFDKMSGKIAKDGTARLEIDLASVNTKIELRDERMRDMLFQTGQHPVALIALKVDPDKLAALEVGDSMMLSGKAELELHGKSAELPVTMTVARLKADRLLVVSEEPVIVNAGQFGLDGGLEALREIAGLPSISPAVPVSFILAFEKS